MAEVDLCFLLPLNCFFLPSPFRLQHSQKYWGKHTHLHTSFKKREELGKILANTRHRRHDSSTPLHSPDRCTEWGAHICCRRPRKEGLARWAYLIAESGMLHARDVFVWMPAEQAAEKWCPGSGMVSVLFFFAPTFELPQSVQTEINGKLGKWYGKQLIDYKSFLPA